MSSRRAIVTALAALSLAGAFASAGAGSAMAEAAQKKKGGGLSYIQLDSLTATIVRTNGRRGTITVDLGMDVPDNGLHQRAVLSAPRLRAGYVQWLVNYAAGLAPGQPPDADYMSLNFQRATDQALGKPGAKVLLGAILLN
jgi:hypothetical protein